MIIVASVWIICSVLTYGITYGHFSRKFESMTAMDRSFALFFAAFGPFGLVVSFISSGFARHGLRFKK